MNQRSLFLLCFFSLFCGASFAGQYDAWNVLNARLKNAKGKELSNACRQLVLQEGVELRVLLSILNAERPQELQSIGPDVIKHYDDDKRAFFKTQKCFHQIDSLYTAAYLYHRNKELVSKQRLKGYETKPLTAFDSRLEQKYGNGIQADFGYYNYLGDWIKDNTKTEDEVILAFLKKNSVRIDKLLSYKDLLNLLPLNEQAGDNTAFQKHMTHYSMLAIDCEQGNDYKKVVAYCDTMLKQNACITADEFAKAKRAAIKGRLKDEYLYLLKQYGNRYVDANPYRDTTFGISRKPEDKAFVKSVLNNGAIAMHDNDLKASVNYDLLMLSNRYAETHDFGSSVAYSKRLIRTNKNRKADLFVHYVMESFTEFPDAMKFLGNSPTSVNYDMSFSIYYITLHFVQYNLRGQRVEDSVWNNYLSSLEYLKSRKLFDAENYYWAVDCYDTGIKLHESKYGWYMQHKRPYEDAPTETAATAKNREDLNLLPYKYMNK